MQLIDVSQAFPIRTVILYCLFRFIFSGLTIVYSLFSARKGAKWQQPIGCETLQLENTLALLPVQSQYISSLLYLPTSSNLSLDMTK